MLRKLKTRTGQSAQVTEKSARSVVAGAWNLALDLIWLLMVAVVVSLFVWGLVKSGIAADQPVLTAVGDKVDALLIRFKF